MAVEYAGRGLVGVLVPQANTTVEPEFAILWPPGVAGIAARMTSAAPAMEARLVDYFDRLDAWADQFANAPVGAVAVACTGASYLVGLARERALVAALAARLGVPVITAGLAVADALGALGARRVALVSPYPDALTAASVRYWTAHGIAVGRVVRVAAAAGAAFHPIYAMPAQDARRALRALDDAPGHDAVVLLGTGMPTLAPILDTPRAGGAPVLSCMLALAWRTVLALDRAAPDRAGLLRWIDKPPWRARLLARTGQAGGAVPAPGRPAPGRPAPDTGGPER